MLTIERPLHVAVLVTDLAKAQAFYGGVLNLQQVDRSMNFPGAWYQVGTFQIHLIVEAAEQTHLPNAEKWGRNPHIAFAVADLDVARVWLRDQGCLTQESASGRAALFTQDPDGNIIELSQA